MAMELEFMKDFGSLEFTNESLPNTLPVCACLLICKADPNAPVQNDLGRIFKCYNVIEYTGPERGLNIDSFMQGLVQAGFIKMNGDHVNEVPVEEVTISYFAHSYPRDLIKLLRKKNFEIEEDPNEPGILHWLF